MIYRKNEEHVCFDKLSISDYFNAAAIILIKESEGPNMLNDISYGRQDVQSEKEAGDTKNIPNEQNFKSKLSQNGLTNEEIVALSAVYGFGVV